MQRQKDKFWISTAQVVLGSLLVLWAGCDKTSPAATPETSGTITSAAPPAQTNPTPTGLAAAAATPAYTYEVIHTWPHDDNAFTQGLVYLNGLLLESTGLSGESTLRRVELQTGKVLQRFDIPFRYFAEGLAVLNGKIYQLTWQNNKGFVYDLDTFRLEREFPYAGEGWGLTTDGKSLIMSDGTAKIRFLDATAFTVWRTITVSDHNRPIHHLNELEYVKGEILANVWQTDEVVRIDPTTGTVLGRIDFTGLLSPKDRSENTDVFNGIAYDAAGDRLFVTGKRWPKLFEVRLKLK